MRTASLLACLWLSGVGLSGGEKKPPAGVREYRALAAEYDTALEKFQKAYREADTPQRQQEVFRRLHPRPEVWAPRFMALARQFADGPTAVDALVWVVTHPAPPDTPQATLRSQALERLAQKHAGDNRVGRLCTQLVQTADAASEAFLAAVFQASPSRPVQARACASLAVNMKFRARLIGRLKEEADAVAAYERALGKPAVRLLLKRDPAALLARSEKLFEQVAEKYGKLEHPRHGSLGELARAHLLSLRQPVEVGRPAPEVAGTAVDGKPMKLSDFRGKVVLLDFWAHAFAPSRAQYDYEKRLLRRLAGKPFAVVGVNGDADRAAAAKVMKAEALSWRSWCDGGTDGPLATRWEVDLWPTLFLLDHQGVVRHIFVGWPERKTLDAAIDALVVRAEK